MSAVQDSVAIDDYRFPTLRVEASGENKAGTMLRKVVLPFCWIHAIKSASA